MNLISNFIFFFGNSESTRQFFNSKLKISLDFWFLIRLKVKTPVPGRTDFGVWVGERRKSVPKIIQKYTQNVNH